MLRAGLISGAIIGFISSFLLGVGWAAGSALNRLFGRPDLENWIAVLYFVSLLPLWFVGGILAARFVQRSAPGAGMISGLVSAAIRGLIHLSLIFGPPQNLTQLPPYKLDLLPFLFILFFLIGGLAAAILGAIGGALGWRRPAQKAG